MRVNREELLRKLESVSPGLAVKEAVEQSSCFAFKGGSVVTFNDEVACRTKCDVGFEGAVAAKPLLELLAKMPEEEVDVGPTDGGLLVKGKRRRSTIVMEADITLPVGVVDRPDKWRPVDAEFSEAISIVQHCAGKDYTHFYTVCIHITPDYVEACDNFHAARYPVATGVVEPCLVKKESIKHIVGLGMTKVGATNAWLHYRNPSGLVFSLRREQDDYPEVDGILEVRGTKTTLPNGLADAIGRAEIFSSENPDENKVVVELRAKQLSLRGRGASGWYEERRDVVWNGSPFAFTISPNLLLEILERTNECYIADNRLIVDNGKFVYVTSVEQTKD